MEALNTVLDLLSLILAIALAVLWNLYHKEKSRNKMAVRRIHEQRADHELQLKKLRKFVELQSAVQESVSDLLREMERILIPNAVTEFLARNLNSRIAMPLHTQSNNLAIAFLDNTPLSSILLKSRIDKEKVVLCIDFYLAVSDNLQYQIIRELHTYVAEDGSLMEESDIAIEQFLNNQSMHTRLSEELKRYLQSASQAIKT